MEITMIIKIGETELTLTVEEFKELKKTLDTLFQSDDCWTWQRIPSTFPIYPQDETSTDIIYSDSQTTDSTVY